MDEKSQKPPKSHSSGPHRLQLDAHLSRNTPKEMMKAQKQFEEAASSVPPSRPTAESRPEVQELGDATTKLGDSVDKICEALVMVFGRISDVSDVSKGQTILLRSVLRWTISVTVLQGVVALVMVFLAVMQVQVTKQSSQIISKQDQAQKDLRDVTSEVLRISKEAEATRKTVAEVKKVSDETSRVTIAPDPDKPGGAVVRIVPPPPTEDNKDKSAASPPRPPAPPSRSSPVVIPLKVDEARRD